MTVLFKERYAFLSEIWKKQTKLLDLLKAHGISAWNRYAINCKVFEELQIFLVQKSEAILATV